MRRLTGRGIAIGIACLAAGAVVLPPTVAVGADIVESYTHVTNTEPDPVITREVREPFTKLVNLTLAANTEQKQAFAFKVPNGKRLVIESLNGESSLYGMKDISVQVAPAGANFYGVNTTYVQGTYRGVAGYTQWTAHDSVLAHANPGDTVNVGVGRSCVSVCNGNDGTKIVISGWLEPISGPFAPAL